MTTLFKNTIIAQAISLGFDFEQFTDDTTIEEMLQIMVDFFSENSEALPQLEDECEVTSHGRSQNVSYGDYTSSGEIVDFSENWHKDPSHKVFHSDFVMEDGGIMKNMRLYYLVGETDYNAPDGFWFNPKTKKHEIFEA
jgi:hypothetical protein